jgi:AraC family transcriptional regulator, activator of mtrCDE
VALLPHGSPHIVHGSATPAHATGPFGIRSNSAGTILLKTNTNDGPDAQLLCDRLKFDHASHNLVLSALPEAIVVTGAQNRATKHMRALIALVKEELDASRPGSSAVAADLASALLVMVVRTHLETERAPRGLLSPLSPCAGGTSGRRDAK